MKNLIHRAAAWLLADQERRLDALDIAIARDRERLEALEANNLMLRRWIETAQRALDVDLDRDRAQIEALERRLQPLETLREHQIETLREHHPAHAHPVKK